MDTTNELSRTLDQVIEVGGNASATMKAAEIELDRRAARIEKLEEVLYQIVEEYDDTYDASIEPGDANWTSAASIPVEVMERAKALLR